MRIFARIICTVAWVLALGIIGKAGAQQGDDGVARELETYRAMMQADPWSNPGMLDVDRGEALWKTPGGPKNVSLEGCDLGLGPGIVDGAFARLPRYFADADRVMDVETRVLWCMEKLQGFERSKLITRAHPGAGMPVKDWGRSPHMWLLAPMARCSPPTSATPRRGRHWLSAKPCSFTAVVQWTLLAPLATPIAASAFACNLCPSSASRVKHARSSVSGLLIAFPPRT